LRTLLFTGKGGVGKTSVAAATAVATAAAGKRTLIMSTDPAHSLGDAFDETIGPRATQVTKNLWAEQLDSQQRLQEGWREIQTYAVELLAWLGLPEMEAEELSVIPGVDELFSLADLKKHAREGAYEVVILDCAPTAETLRLLSLPEVLTWYIEKIFPVERKVMKTVRPLLQHVRSIPPLASDDVFAAVERFYMKIDGIKEMLTDPRDASIRLVVNPEKMVLAEAERTFTYLCMFGYRVDAIVMNRVLPSEVTDPYFGAWRKIQADNLERAEDSFSPVPILRSRLLDTEIVGLGPLQRLAVEVYEDTDPSEVLYRHEVMKVVESTEGRDLFIRLPFTEKDEVELSRKSGELFVKVGNFKRNLTLPQSLKSSVVTGASFQDDFLKVSFV